MQVYLIHFDQPIGGEGRNSASHYVGWAADSADERAKKHATNPDAAIMAYLKDQGIGWKITRVWHGATRQVERQIKNGGHFSDLCPCCSGERAVSRRTYGCPTEVRN